MLNLDEIIKDQTPLIVQRALVVKMSNYGISAKDISKMLGVAVSFVYKWCNEYTKNELDNLTPRYKGSCRLLGEAELKKIGVFLEAKETCSLEELMSFISDKFGVEYKSKQSYYDIFREFKMSWKKTEQSNPKKDEEQVSQRREEIKKNFTKEGTKSCAAIWSY